MSFIEIKNLCVNYGTFKAVKNLNISIPKGDVFGFIGPNGAGKSSTIKVLATLLRPSKGTAHIDGINVVASPGVIRRRIGYVPDFFGVYDDLTAEEYLHFFAAAYKIQGEKRKRVVHDVLELTDLTDKIYVPVDSLSRGMKQRLSLARVLLHDPDLLLLDEPASGLDPRARIEIRELLKELRAMGKTIIISSHILQELAQLCTSIGIIETGSMIVQGSLDDIYQQMNLQQTVHVQLANESPELLKKIEGIPGVVNMETMKDRISVKIQEASLSVPDFHQALVTAGAQIYMFQPEAIDMETVFMKLTEGKTQ